MANIERRRNRRKLNAIIAAAGALLVIAGIIALIIVLNSKKKPSPASEPGPTAYETQAPETEEPTSAVTETELPATPESATAEPTQGPSGTEETPSVPIRISDDLSLVIVTANITTRYNAQGQPRPHIEGSIAVQFVNNTDSVLYSAEFIVTGMNSTSAALDGIASNYSFGEDGLLKIPFFNELNQTAYCDILIEFTADPDPSNGFAMPVFGYDTSYLLNAFISSDVSLTFEGCKAVRDGSDGYAYSVTDASVHEVVVDFGY